jgi:hypothetical protein
VIDFESWLVAREPALQRRAFLRTTPDGAIQRASETAPYDPEGERFGLAPNLFP